MRKIEITEMEKVNGGDWLSCAGSVAGLVATVGIAAAAASITAGGALLFIVAFNAGGVASAINCGKAI